MASPLPSLSLISKEVSGSVLESPLLAVRLYRGAEAVALSEFYHCLQCRLLFAVGAIMLVRVVVQTSRMSHKIQKVVEMTR